MGAVANAAMGAVATCSENAPLKTKLGPNWQTRMKKTRFWSQAILLLTRETSLLTRCLPGFLPLFAMPPMPPMPPYAPYPDPLMLPYALYLYPLCPRRRPPVPPISPLCPRPLPPMPPYAPLCPLPSPPGNPYLTPYTPPKKTPLPPYPCEFSLFSEKCPDCLKGGLNQEMVSRSSLTPPR